MNESKYERENIEDHDNSELEKEMRLLNWAKYHRRSIDVNHKTESKQEITPSNYGGNSYM